jgi:hypothetical protein
MRSHFRISNAAMACAVSGATSMLSGTCSAQIAADYATNSTYAGGWLAGQNGGYGFTAWSFGGTTGSPIQQRMSDSSSFNHLGRAWTLFNPLGATNGTDLANAGRGFAPLQIGQTFETVIDNPTQRNFYRGYTIRLGSGTDNTAVERLAAYTFEYFSYGKWFVGYGSGHNNGTSLFDTDTAPAGMRLDVTLTGANNYHLSMTPLNNPANAYTQDGTLGNSGPVDWIQFQFYNTASDPTKATDFYISSLTIVPEPSTLAFLGLGSAGLLFLRRRK